MNNVFNSHIGSLIRQYISEKRAVGYDYKNNEYYLSKFDEYCCDKQLDTNNIDYSFLKDWIEMKQNESVSVYNCRISATRGFLFYLLSRGFDVFVPLNHIKEYRKLPYILTEDEICAIFSEIDKYNVHSPARCFQRAAVGYRVILRLIYTCGLRLSEACNLHTEDVDLQNSLLILHDTKTKVDRLVYMSSEMNELCKEYLSFLQKELGFTPEWFFPAAKNTNNHVEKTLIEKQFSNAWKKTSYYGTKNDNPTVHDLRFTFVTRTITKWMRSGKDVKLLMPYLVKYLGHKDFTSTHYYFMLTEEAFDIVQEKDTISKRVIPKVKI